MDDFDEFGNFIGEVRYMDEEEEEELAGNQRSDDHDDDGDMFNNNGDSIANAIVLHEHKAMYPSAQSVFGDSVEIITEDDSTPVPKSKPLLPREEIIKEKKRKHAPKSQDDTF